MNKYSKGILRGIAFILCSPIWTVFYIAVILIFLLAVISSFIFFILQGEWENLKNTF